MKPTAIPSPDRSGPRRGPRKRRRRVRRRAGYLPLPVTVLTLLLLAVLLVCGVLYIKEHVFPSPQGPDQNLSAVSPEDAGPDLPAGEAAEPDRYQGEEPAPSGSASAVVVIDPGHGGVQPGCEFDGVLEKDITLAVSLLLREELEERGVTVILTRDGDEDVELEDRCAIANEAGADLFVSIHCNSFTEDASVSGFEGYYYQSPAGKRLAERILQAAADRSVRTRHVKEENYLVLRDTSMPSALLEIGFLSNKGEREKLLSADYQAELAGAVAEGILDTLGLS